jgi:hypothetical protein
MSTPHNKLLWSNTRERQEDEEEKDFAAEARALAKERHGANYGWRELSACQDEVRRRRLKAQARRPGPYVYDDIHQAVADQQFAALIRERAAERAAAEGRCRYTQEDLSRAGNEVVRKHPALFALSRTTRASEEVPLDPDPPGAPGQEHDEADDLVPCNNCNGLGEMPDGETCPECDGRGRVVQQEQMRRPPPPPQKQPSDNKKADVTRWTRAQLAAALRRGRVTKRAYDNEILRRDEAIARRHGWKVRRG